MYSSPRPLAGRGWLAALLAAALGATAFADNPNDKPILRAGPIPVEQWLKASTNALTAGELDQLISREQQAARVKPAPLTTDEQFIRRVYLDVTGRLPMPADVTEFVANPDSKKRAKLIDKLLDSDEYAQQWAAYWRQVIGIRLTSAQGRGLQRNFERWLTKQFKENTGWHVIAREMLTFQGPAKFDDEKAGPAFFLGSHLGADSVVEQAAETSRVLMGVQINCAQCHDHPFDAWKREQFHQLAAYFARIRPRPLREEMRLVGIDMSAAGRQAEHRIPDKNNPRTGTPVNPRFLDGTAPGRGLSDKERRNSLAASITSKNNPWFAAAFVNRIWGELLGQSFYTPIDDLGPQKEAVFSAVLTRLAGAFRGSDYNVKDLYRVILNSETYQRQSRGSDNSGDHMQFAASYPTRLKADALWESLQHVLGKMSTPGGGGGRRGPLGFGGGGIEGLVKVEFGFDPSLKPDDVEGSIPQALILMNSPPVQQRIKATGTNLLGRILSSHSEDGPALDMVYLRTLARKPTDREKTKCLDHIKKASSRGDAFEDVLWALLNSTEFQTRR
jgi:Protein of unknown function (DUF1549)/Protein of unknown function (DUF1553)